MEEGKKNIQDTFLNYIRKNKTHVTVFLVNGVKLQGTVTAFDMFCIILHRNNLSQLIYKHAISTVVPAGTVPLFGNGQESGGHR